VSSPSPVGEGWDEVFKKFSFVISKTSLGKSFIASKSVIKYSKFASSSTILLEKSSLNLDNFLFIFFNFSCFSKGKSIHLSLNAFNLKYIILFCSGFSFKFVSI
jgi:hypothetical protein